MAARFDIDALTRDENLVARMASAEEVFSFLSRSLRLPASCVALVWDQAGPPTVVSGGRQIEEGSATRLLIARTTAFSLSYEAHGLSSEDGYEISAQAQMTVRIVPERSELTGFVGEIMGSAQEVTIQRLHHYCSEVVRSAIGEFVRQRPADRLLSPEAGDEFDTILAAKFKALGFASGLALGADPRIAIQSPDFAEARRDRRVVQQRQGRLEEERRLRELAAQARREHLSELAQTLDQLRDLSQQNQTIAQLDLIKTFGPSQRGNLYHALVAQHRGGARTEAIVVAAGEELLWFDPAAPSKPTRTQSLATEIGPLRSVRTASWEGRRVLLIGARQGVHLLESEQDPRTTFAFKPSRELRGGVNAATIVGQRLYATHSEAGLIRWPLRKPSEFEFPWSERFLSCRSVRDVQHDDEGAVWLAADNGVYAIVGDGQAGGAHMGAPCESPEPRMLSTPATVTALCVADRRVFAGLENGQIVAWQGDAAAAESVRPAGGAAVTSLAWLEGGGVPRLLVGDNRSHLAMIVLGDAFSAQYRCGQSVRWGFAAPDIIVGVNDRRDQLIIWRTETPHEPAAVIHVRKFCGRSIQDAALIVAT
jgi:hypothetical protein